MKKHGHYCKICGEYKSNEKFSGKGHAAYICKACSRLPAEKRSEMMILNKLLNLPWRLSKEQKTWLKNKTHDRRPEIKVLAQEQYDLRFNPKRFISESIDEEEDAFLDTSDDMDDIRIFE